MEVPNLQNCKLNPHLQIIRGIDYLENCCKTKQLLTIPESEKLFKNGKLNFYFLFILSILKGGIIVPATDIILEEDNILNSIINLLKKVF